MKILFIHRVLLNIYNIYRGMQTCMKSGFISDAEFQNHR